MAKKATRLIAVSFILCFLLFLSASTFSVQAWGRPKKTQMDYQYRQTGDEPPEEMWFSDDGTWLHTRNHVHYYDVLVNDKVVGTLVYEDNALNLHLPTLSGYGGGRQTMTLTHKGKTGTISCYVFFRIAEGGFITGLIIGRGSGDFQGMWHIGKSTGNPFLDPIFTVDGILIG